MKMNSGVFAVSLDFELYWGLRDRRTIDEYRSNLLGVRQAVLKLLRMFDQNDIHATWAAVGFLFFKNDCELRRNFPMILPTYKESRLSPYTYIENCSELEPAYHFAPDVIQSIMSTRGQEIGTHTFSHYYCDEKGQNIDQFEADISAAISVASRMGLRTASLVFPRNQCNERYLSSIFKFGISSYRGNQTNWFYRDFDDSNRNWLQRSLRLIDSYVNLSGNNTYALSDCIRQQPFNFPASRFLRPYSKKIAAIDWLRLRRIKLSMSYAAQNGRLFHLWWHPHNFGVDTDNNLEFLAKIVDHYKFLRLKYGMQSLNMGELSQMHMPQDADLP